MKVGKKLKTPSKKKIVCELVYNEKYLKTRKKKAYSGKINTSFHNNKILKNGSQPICWSVILIDSALRTSCNCFPQVFLEECK